MRRKNEGRGDEETKKRRFKKGKKTPGKKGEMKNKKRRK